MKTILLAGSLLFSLSSALAAPLAERIDCQTADGAIRATILVAQRPNFVLATYDSEDHAANAGIALSLRQNGQEIAGALTAYAAIAGRATQLNDLSPYGVRCRYGVLTEGTQVAAKITVGGQARLAVLTCDDEVEDAHHGDCDP